MPGPPRDGHALLQHALVGLVHPQQVASQKEATVRLDLFLFSSSEITGAVGVSTRVILNIEQPCLGGL